MLRRLLAATLLLAAALPAQAVHADFTTCTVVYDGFQNKVSVEMDGDPNTGNYYLFNNPNGTAPALGIANNNGTSAQWYIHPGHEAPTYYVIADPLPSPVVVVSQCNSPASFYTET